MLQAILPIVAILAAYIVGSIPTGYWLAKMLKGIDIRTVGSGSTGATNVWRCVGKGAGIAVFVIDVLKGYAPVAAAIYLESTVPEGAQFGGSWHPLPAICALITLVGHSKSIFLGFQGGKSAATGLGTIVALNPIASLCTFAVWITIVVTTRIVSIASIIGVAANALFLYLFHSPPSYVVYGVCAFIYITWRHKSNIKRLMEGTEQRLGEKPKNFTEETTTHETADSHASQSQATVSQQPES